MNEALKPRSKTPECLKLPGGIRIILKNNRSSKLASIAAVTPGGVRTENSENNGITALMSSLIQRGTRKRSYEQIAHIVSMHGAYCESFVGRNSFGLKMDCLSETFSEALIIYFDQLVNSVYPQNHVEIEKAKAIEELRTLKDNFDAYLYDEFLKALYKDHPYSFNTLGTLKALKRITREDILESYSRSLDPKNLIISIVGNFNRDEVLRICDEQLKSVQRKLSNDFESINMPQLKKGRKINKRIQSQNAYIQIGFRGTTVKSDDKYSLEIANAALTSFGGSRLYSELREKRGLVYSVFSSIFHGIDEGYVSIYLNCAPGNKDRAIGKVHDVIEDIKTGLKREELARIKSYLIGSYEIELQRNSAQAVIYGLNELYGLPLDMNSYADDISRVNEKQVREAIEKYLDLSRSIQIVLSP